MKIDIKEKWHCEVKWEDIVGTATSAGFHVTRELLTIWNCLTYRPTFPFEVWVMRFKLSKICKNRSKPWKCWLCWLASYECWLLKSRVLAPKFVLKFRCGHRLDSKRLGNRWFVSVSMVILVKASTILQYDMELSIGMGLGICILCISMHSRFHWE